MSEPQLFNALLIAFFGLAAVSFPMLFFITAPYGRYTRKSWGPTLNRRLGWILMEAPSSLLFAGFFFLGHRAGELVPLVFLAMWQVHYLHRAFIFPFRMRGARQGMTVATVALGICFNLFNGYLNGRYVGAFGPELSAAWLLDPRFLVGALLFVLGLGINLQSDSILINLRQPGDTSYRIPRGGLFGRVSCPNYLGEVVEWSGWALATWSLPGLAFAVWTAANLVPRAWSHHRWYVQQFPDYPKERRAIIPYLL